MRRPARGAASATALHAAFLVTSNVAEAHGDAACSGACEVGQALIIAVPAVYGASALATDVGTLVHLTRTGSVPLSWSVAGTVLWVPATIGSAIFVAAASASAASDDASVRADAPLALGLSITGFALSAGSLALQIYALGRAPERRASPAAARALRAPAQVRWVGLAPWSAPQAAGWSAGVTTLLTF